MDDTTAAPDDETNIPAPARLEGAFGHFVERLRAAETTMRGFEAAADDGGRARGYLHLLRMVVKAVEEELLADPDHPRFRILDDRVRSGGDNPDQRYLFARIRGGQPYRVHGRLGAAARVEIQLYSREPHGGEDVGVGYLAHEQIRFGPDGSFAVDLVAEPDPSATDSVLHCHPDASIVNVRQIYDRWTADDPGAVYIDKVGAEGDRKTTDEADRVAAAIERAADDLFASTECWPSLVAQGIVGPLPANTLSPLVSPGDRAGVVGRWISIGPYEVGPDEALVICVPEVGAAYQGIQLADHWFASLEYASATSSLTGAQSLAGPDGTFRYVIALEDPGYANWLDPTGLPKGVVHIRLDGVNGDISATSWPR